nr:immunoglobulin light chain junction region [Macaca mulatta]MOX51153.1 immunoglobulin light chain junction region [Macaca mulatta]
CYQCYSGLTF